MIINLTIACAMVDRHVANIKEYADTKNDIVEHIIEYAKQFTSRKVNAQMNVADNIEQGSVYITVTGTSAEMGDDGAVGRGNRANGLITPNRPMSLEATCGKNPINHVGKIYNLLSTEAARQIAAEVQGIEEVYIKILSQIGKPIDEPHIASVQIVPKEGVDMKSWRPGPQRSWTIGWPIFPSCSRCCSRESSARIEKISYARESMLTGDANWIMVAEYYNSLMTKFH